MIKTDGKTFELGNEEIRYILRVNEYGYLENLWFGKKIEYSPFLKNGRVPRSHEIMIAGARENNAFAGNFRLECSTPLRGDYRTPSFCGENLKTGSGVFDFKYDTFAVITKDFSSVLPKTEGGETLKITLKDAETGVKIHLFYTVYDDVNAIVRSVEIENCGDTDLNIDRAYSFCLDLPNDEYYVTGLYGQRLKERLIEKNKLFRGIYTIDSKRGESSAVINPFAAVSENGADEESGSVYGFNLIYSGNFEFKLELDEFGGLRVVGGVSAFNFGWNLKKGESFETPECVLVYSDKGFGKMSRTFHDLYREYLLNKNFAKKARPIVINNWEATDFRFNEDKLKGIIDSAYKFGADTFVLDDGWFIGRNDDTAALGDWVENTVKLPCGIKGISDYCHKKGMKFGLWFEPEMVSEKSELYKKHPEWVVKVPDREPLLGRNQMTLDLSNDEVVEFITDTLSKHIESDRLDYIKWDMNRPMTEFYSNALPPERQKEFAHRYILGLYKALKMVTEKYPHVLIEGCAAGGCRFDAGILKYCPQVWTSDNTDAIFRSEIQNGTSYVYPLSSMSNHVSVCPNHQTGRTTSLETRFDVAKFGVLGYEFDTTKLSENEIEDIKKFNDQYIKERNLILNGDYYRGSCREFSADRVISKDKKQAILRIVYGVVKLGFMPQMIKVYGLDSNKTYRIVETGEELKGEVLIRRGFFPPYTKKDFVSFVFHVLEV